MSEQRPSHDPEVRALLGVLQPTDLNAHWQLNADPDDSGEEAAELLFDRCFPEEANDWPLIASAASPIASGPDESMLFGFSFVFENAEAARSPFEFLSGQVFTACFIQSIADDLALDESGVTNLAAVISPGKPPVDIPAECWTYYSGSLAEDSYEPFARLGALVLRDRDVVSLHLGASGPVAIDNDVFDRLGRAVLARLQSNDGRFN